MLYSAVEESGKHDVQLSSFNLNDLNTRGISRDVVVFSVHKADKKSSLARQISRKKSLLCILMAMYY